MSLIKLSAVFRYRRTLNENFTFTSRWGGAVGKPGIMGPWPTWPP